jgi:lipoate---protein ligase
MNEIKMDTKRPDAIMRPYALPDAILIDPEATTNAFMVWQPSETVIVLGQSNQAETAVHTGLAEQDGVLVFKRHSGGQTVVLTPRTLVISVRLIAEKLDNPQVYFKRINGLILWALTGLGIAGLVERGISDIAIGEKKILGSSIYRKRNMVFYHAVLNLSETPEFIGRYLKHPAREPDYRIGRKHEEFVTSICLAGYPLAIETVQEAITKMLNSKI